MKSLRSKIVEMDLSTKIRSFLSNLVGNNTVDTRDMIEFRQSKIELLKGEISTIIDGIDGNEETYLEMKKSTEDQIEKGFPDGDSLKDHLEERYSKRRDDLMKSLASKKIELKRHETKIEALIQNELEKAKKAQDYGDSIVRDTKGNILMLLRKNDDSFEPNKWGLPGGKIELGEEPKEGAIRELKEETNLTAESCSKAAEVVLPEGGKIYYYHVYPEEGESMVALDEEEHSNYCFMSVNEIKKRPATDFIMTLKPTLLKIVDPLYEHYQVIKKGHDSGEIDDDTFSKAMSNYEAFGLAKAEE